MNKHAKIFIEGIVQGVGFRPHVYNMAKTFDLRGYVLNDSRGVTIEIEGDMAVLKKFAENLRNNPPRLSDIQGFICQFSDEIAGYNDFFIKKSEDIGDKTVLISPDICVCDDCLREMEDPEDRRFAYPFINCTNCGPRYTIVTDVPYDRKNTSMADFPLCDYCKAQYEEPSNRRFHAQPVACSQCGPRLFLYDKNGNEICKNPSNIPDAAAKLLHQGKIIAIKGLGGYHLAVDAKNHSAVCILRERKYREDKPFAVMFSNVREVEEQCFVSEAEAALLSSFKAPIVLLKKRDKISLSPGVAPNNLYLGVMLAYTPMHHLILKAFQGCLVMTSGNVSDEPICYKDLFAAEHLFGIADFFLSHNRPIHIRCDDTVTRVFDGQEYLLRRSRGYAPFPIITKNFTSEPVLAVGAELKNTICIYRGNQAILSHHIGDLENNETFESFESTINHIEHMFDVYPQTVVHDLHPRYLSTQYAKSKDFLKKISVQHHHAHIVSLMEDRGLDGDVIGVALDGVGYGSDGNLWGFEFMRANFEDFDRFIHLKYAKMPGGEKSVKEPWRMAMSYVYDALGEHMFDIDFPFLRLIERKKIKFVKKMLNSSMKMPLISSAGRLFDAVSAMLGIRCLCNYEGQAAIEMEMLAAAEREDFYAFNIDRNVFPMVIKPDGIIRGIADDIVNGENLSGMAGKFHNSIAEIVTEGCLIISGITGLKRVALSGGVFQNMLLLEKCINRLEKSGFSVYIHQRVPTNDGGISLGQAAIAAKKLKMESC